MTATDRITMAANDGSVKERTTPDVDAVVVGAGFAGLYLLHRLRGLGFSVRAFESGADVGGTWYWNRYPGGRCDIQSLDYSWMPSTLEPALADRWASRFASGSARRSRRSYIQSLSASATIDI